MCHEQNNRATNTKRRRATSIVSRVLRVSKTKSVPPSAYFSISCASRTDIATHGRNCVRPNKNFISELNKRTKTMICNTHDMSRERMVPGEATLPKHREPCATSCPKNIDTYDTNKLGGCIPFSFVLDGASTSVDQSVAHALYASPYLCVPGPTSSSCGDLRRRRGGDYGRSLGVVASEVHLCHLSFSIYARIAATRLPIVAYLESTWPEIAAQPLANECRRPSSAPSLISCSAHALSLGQQSLVALGGSRGGLAR